MAIQDEMYKRIEQEINSLIKADKSRTYVDNRLCL